MKNKLQIFTQIAFLAVFILLFIKGRVQLWMGVFLLGILASFLFSRIYCGWVCPINTIMRTITWIKRKLKIKSLKIPKFLIKGWVRFFILGLFVIVFVFTMITGKKLPILPILFAIGILLTFFFPEELWHRYLCPFGTILSLPATKAMHNLSIDPDLCNNCGACKRICPANAIEKGEHNHNIIKQHCLVCMDCTTVCKQNAISYK